MQRRASRHWLLVSLVALAASVPLACGDDPGKKTAYGEGGEGGGAGSPLTSSGGSNVQPQGGKAGTAGMSSNGGAPDPGGGEAGGPVDVLPGDGGTGVGGVLNEPTAGTPNEPTAGAPNSPLLPQCEGVLSFKDSYVEDQVRGAIAKPTGDLVAADVSGLTEIAIPFNDDNIDITGLECLSGLTHLDFSGGGGGQPLDVLLLLPNLESIDLHDGYISDLAPFAVLTNVKSLDFSDNWIADVTPLAGLTQLEHLGLGFIGDFNQTPLDITALGNLTNLVTLDLSSDELKDGAPLKGLTKLQELLLAGTQVPSAAFVEDLTALRTLDLSGMNLTVLPDLSALTQLTSLSLASDKLADFTSLGSLTTLTALNLSSTDLTSLAPLAPLLELETLDLSYDQFADASVLGALPALGWLDISYNNSVTSLQPLIDSQYWSTGDQLTAYLSDCVTHGPKLQALQDKGVVVTQSCF